MLDRQRSVEKKCEKQPCNSKLREGSAAGAEAGMPLQPVQTVVEHVSMLQPVEGHTLEEGKSVRRKDLQRGAVID